MSAKSKTKKTPSTGAISPALLKKYLAAARFIADHLMLKPRGFVFAPHPVVL